MAFQPTLSSLMSTYRTVLGDDLPTAPSVADIAQALCDQSPAKLKELDQALQSHGVQRFLASVKSPMAADSIEWALDDKELGYSEDLDVQGRSYLRQMIAHGVDRGPNVPEVEFEPLYPGQIEPVKVEAFQHIAARVRFEGMSEADYFGSHGPVEIVIRPLTETEEGTAALRELDAGY